MNIILNKKLASMLTLIVLAFILVACNLPNNGNPSDDKSAPIYQGMVVSSNVESTNTTLNFGVNNEGDELVTDDEIDQEDPFNNFDGETIEDEIEDAFGVISSQEIEYYTTTGQDFYITIRLLNPSNYVILSFILNGTFYQSYQFQEGSDSENLILKTNAGANPGIREYTIDAIKYVDGSEIKDAVIGGNQTVKVGVRFDNVPIGQVIDHSVTSTSVSFTAQISDPEGLILTAGNHLKAVLYDGDQIIRNQDITLGSTVITFDQLTPNKLYQYGIITAYDILDGSGVIPVLLDSFAFMTEDIFSLELNEVDQTSFSFSIVENDIKEVGNVEKIELLLDDVLVETADSIAETSFDSLLSNNMYILRVTYVYQFGLESNPISLIKELEVTTNPMTLPIVEVTDVVIGLNNVTFNYEIDDVDDIATFVGVKLFRNNEIVDSIDGTSELEFDNLYTNNDYVIGFEFTADLNDGDGVKNIYVEYAFKTLSKNQPMIDFVDIETTKDTISFDLHITDIDMLGELVAIQLLDGETVIQNLENLNLKSFNNLLSNYTYQIQAIYAFDDGDSHGIRNRNFDISVTTLAKTIPTAEIIDLHETQTGFTFNINLVDPDSTAVITDMKLYQNGNLYKTINDVNLRTIEDISEDTVFNFEVTFTYNLNDGTGNKVLLIEHEVFTKPYLEIVSTEVINTGKLTEGDTLWIEMTLDNPTNVDVVGVTINDNEVAVDPVSTNSFVRLAIVIDDSYAGGWTNFIITNIVGLKDGSPRAFEVEEYNETSVFINGDIFVNEIFITDENEEELNMTMVGQKYYIHVLLDNPTGYEIKSLNFSYPLNTILSTDSNWSINDDNDHIVIEVTSSQSFTTYTYDLEKLVYLIDNSLDDIIDIQEKEKTIENIRDSIILMNSTEYIMIYDAAGLAGIRNGFAYKLANDIDMTNVIWTPKSIQYVILDGNGYAINNFRHVETKVDTAVSYGLFTQVNNSTITNLVMNDALILITMNRSTTSSNYYGEIAIFATAINNSVVTNAIINGEISLQNNTGEYYQTRVGTLAARISDNSTISNIYIDATVVSNGSVGGVSSNTSDSIFKAIYTTGEVIQLGNNSYYAGGVFGEASNVKISDIYSSMVVSGSSYVGGLIGATSQVTLSNSYYNGQVTSINWGQGLIIGNSSSSTINNVFAFTNQNINTLGSFYSGTINNLFVNLNSDPYASYKSLEQLQSFAASNWNNFVWSFTNELPQLKWKPTIRINNVNSTGMTISFKLLSTDLEGVGEIVSVELYKGATLIATIEDLSVLEFENLTYNTTYTIKVTYSYDYQDEAGIQYIYSSINVKTKPIEGAPEVEFDELFIGDNQVDFTLDISDEIGGSIFEINLYSSTYQLLDTLNTFDSLQFMNLESNTTYILEVIYQFDMGDGSGTQFVDDIYIFTTNPEFNVTGINLNNTDDIYSNTPLVIDISIDNPNGIEFSSVVINGISYPISRITTDNLRITIPGNSILGVGEVNLNLEAINGTFNSVNKHYDFIPGTYSLETYIFGDIYIENFTITDDEGKAVDLLENGNSYVVEVRFFNPSQYIITSLSSSFLSTNLVDLGYLSFDEGYTILRYPFIYNDNSSMVSYNITGFGYSSEHLENDLYENVTDFKVRLSSIPNSSPVYVSTIDDLKNVTGNGYFILMNDIDLDGVSWVPKSFNGFFDGNNHTISNLNKIGSYNNTSISFGLFSSISSATVINLRLENFNFILNFSFEENNYNPTKVGALAAEIENSVIKSVFINSDIDAKIDGNAYYLNVGNFAGTITNSSISQISISGYIETNSTYAAGIAAVIRYSDLDNIISNVEIGINSNSDNTPLLATVENSKIDFLYSHGISKNYGFLYSVSSYSKITNSVSLSINRNQQTVHPFSWQDSTSKEENNYSNHNYGEYFNLVSIDYINLWVKENFDPSIWNLSSNIPVLKQKPILRIINVTPSEYGFTFSIDENDPDQVGEILNIQLFDGSQLIDELESFDVLSFENIRYSSTYNLKIVYLINYGDTYGEEQIILNQFVQTLDKENIPTIDITDLVIGKESVTFDINVVDSLNVGEVLGIELYDGQDLVASLLSMDEFKFENLLSNHLYTIKAIYSYDFDDNFGVGYITDTLQFTTLAKVPPTISIQASSKENEIKYTINVTSDIESIFALDRVDLISADLVVDSSTSMIGTYINLNAYTEYQVKAYYHYDLNQGNGVTERSVTYTLKTSPHLSLLSFTLYNSDEIFNNDAAIFKLEFDNPSNITLNSAIINGKQTSLNKVDNYYLANVTIDESYVGGNTIFELEEIIGTLNNDSFNILIDENNTVDVFINGRIEVVSFNVTDSNGEFIPFVLHGSTYYVDITFYNPSQYNIISVSGVGVSENITPEMMKVVGDYVHIKYQKNFVYTSSVEIYLSQFTYYNSRIASNTSQIVDYNVFSIPVTYTNSSDMIAIYTVQDFINMNQYGQYILMNDLDLSYTVNWVPKNFNGYLNGNGHKISNLNIVKSYQDNNTHYVGLFGELDNATIENLVLDDFNFVLLLTEGGSNEYAFYGTFAGRVENSNIRNVIIQNAFLNINNQRTSYNSNWHGLAIGDVYKSTILNMSVSGTVETNLYNYSGGVAGRITYTLMKNVVSNVNGAYTGFAYKIEESTLENIFVGGNAVNVAFADNISNSKSKFVNILTTQDIMANTQYRSEVIYINTYSVGYSYYNSGFIQKSLQFIDQFVKETFDETIFNLTNDIPKLILKPTLSIENITSEEYAVSFEIITGDALESGLITSIELLYEDIVFARLEDMSLRTFTELRYSTNYVIRVTYTYSVGNQTFDVISKTPVRTSDKENIPSANIININPSTDSVEFEIEITDTLEVGYLHQIQILDGTTVVSTLETFDNLTFDSLLSNQTYKLRAIYNYDFIDGFGESYVEDIVTFNTDAKTVPTVNVVTSSNETSIQYEVNTTDPDNIFVLDRVELSDGSNVVATRYTINGIFESLEAYHLYTVKVYYIYDLNTSGNIISSNQTQSIKTSPHLSVTGIEIVNGTGLMVGSIMVLDVDLDNPNQIGVTHVVINDVLYEIQEETETGVRLFIDITSEIGGGDINFVVESIRGTYNSETFNITQSSNNTIKTFINGEMSILGIEFVDSEGVPLKYYVRGEPIYADLYLSNPTAYSIDNISIYDTTATYNGFVIIDQNTVRLSFSSQLYSEYIRVQIQNIEYSNEIAGTKYRATNVNDWVVSVNNEIIAISTPHELSQMTSRNIYSMQNNIDLEGIAWNPFIFGGVLLGNGHTISNLSIIQTYEDVSPQVGLFSQINYGYIEDLSLLDVEIITIVKSTIGENLSSYIGLLSAISNYTELYNVQTNGSIVFENRTNGNVFVGGVTGNSSQTKINNVTVSLNVTANSSEYQLAGVLGGNSYYSKIINTYVEIDLSGILRSYYGFSYQDSSSMITNSIAIIDTYYQNQYMNNAYVYSSYSNKYHNNNEQLTYNQFINSIISLWDHNIWDFVNRDSLGIPTLKR